MWVGAQRSFLSLSVHLPDMQHYWLLNSKCLICGRELDKSLRSIAALCSTQALSSFQWAQPLNYFAKVKTDSPKKCLITRIFGGCTGENQRMTINHRPHGMSPWAPACHITPISHFTAMSERDIAPSVSCEKWFLLQCGFPDLYQHVVLSLEGHYICNQETVSRSMVLGNKW